MPDRIRYYVVKGANAFWAPGRQADAFGFQRSVPLGPAGEDAQKAALGWDASDALAETYLLDASDRVQEARVKARAR